jgi:signal transduction histidine kinase
MGDDRAADMERTIGSCRVVLAVCALLAVALEGMVFADASGPNRQALAVLGLHFMTSVVLRRLIRADGPAVARVAALTTWTDVLFAGAIAGVTEGISSPFYAFFVFAVTAAGVRGGMRRAAAVIGAAIGVYLSLIVVAGAGAAFYVMRPVYLSVVGYLIARLGQRRVDLEAEVGHLEAHAERSRIASSLHDGSLQALVGVQLRLEGCRELLRAGRCDAALAEVGDIQDAIAREHDDLRRYVRTLAEVGPGAAPAGDSSEPRVSVRAEFSAPAPLVDEVLQIVREALANVRRHAYATAAHIVVDGAREGGLVVAVDDDGVGLRAGTEPPWSIMQRVRAAGGRLRVEPAAPGAHLRITLPAAG